MSAEFPTPGVIEFGKKKTITKACAALGASALLAIGLGSKPATASEQAPITDTEMVFGAIEDEILSENEEVSEDIAEKIAETGFNMVKVTVPITAHTQCAEVKNDTKRFQNALKAAKKYGLDFAITPITSYTDKTGKQSIGVAPRTASQIRCYSDTIVSYMANFAEVYAGEELTVMPLNEPNLGMFLKPQFDKDNNWIAPKIAARILAEYPKLKREAEKLGIKVNIIGPELSSGKNALEFYKLLKQAKKEIGYSGKLFDHASIHPYGDDHDESPDTPHPNGKVVGIADYPSLRQTIDELFGSDKDIWYSEYGVITDSRGFNVKDVREDQQAEFYKKALEMSYCQKVGAFILFNIQDDETGVWTSGIFDENGEPKPSYEVVKQAIDSAKAGNIIC